MDREKIAYHIREILKEIGENPDTKKMIFFYPTGRYGAYISSNRVNVSVAEQPDLETAIKLINNKAKKK